MPNRMNRRRMARQGIRSGAALVTLGAASGSLLLLPVGGAQAASTAPGPAGSGNSAAFTITPDGWVHYNNTKASTLPLTNPTTVTLPGTIDSNGNCVISSPPLTNKAGAGFFESETAFNPVLCQASFLEGQISSQVAASLGVTQRSVSAPLPPGALSSTPIGRVTPVAGAASGPLALAVPGSASAGLAVPAPASQAATAPAVQAASSTTYKSAYQKDAYLDPFDITITSLAQNMTWGFNSSNQIVSASAYVVPYRFSWDGWGGGGPSSSVYKNGNYTAAINLAYYQSTNTDFENYVLAILGLAGLAACGFDTSPAVFTQNMALTGESGGYQVSSADSATGGCSDLVHRDSENGYGSTS